jgi:hypothetical protein
MSQGGHGMKSAKAPFVGQTPNKSLERTREK